LILVGPQFHAASSVAQKDIAATIDELPRAASR
jgi:hypothetical protein